MKFILSAFAGVVLGAVLSSVGTDFRPAQDAAKEPRLFLAGMEMKLGMPQDKVLTGLKKNYELLEIPSTSPTTSVDTGSWFIAEPRTGKDSLPRVIGSVAFKDSRLIGATKEWGRFRGDDTLEFSKELYDVLKNVTEEVGRFGMVRAYPVLREPGIRMSTIDLVFRLKTVAISIIEGRDGKTATEVTISERLLAP